MVDRLQQICWPGAVRLAADLAVWLWRMGTRITVSSQPDIDFQWLGELLA